MKKWQMHILQSSAKSKARSAKHYWTSKFVLMVAVQLAFDNVEAIAATPGLNALMLGPGDMRLSLGLPSKRIGEQDDPLFLAVVDKLIKVAKKHRKALMTVAFKVSAKSDNWLKHFSLLLTSADILSVVNGHRADLANMKKLLQTYEDEDSPLPVNGAALNGKASNKVGDSYNGHAAYPETNGHKIPMVMDTGLVSTDTAPLRLGVQC
jgi:hypothetical protein